MVGRRPGGRKPVNKAGGNASDSGDNNDISAAESDSYGGENRQISAQEEADLSSALIAKLLAEDSGGGSHYRGYYDDYSNGAALGETYDDGASGSEADDDWDPSRKKQRRPKKSAAAAAPKKERPPPLPVAPGQYRSGAYTDEEELKFNEGLELYGRSWGEISTHVVTRDAKSIRSHAQKYFIKLFRDSIPLPAKVRESGEGYTLSGRPLDPNSAAARPYLQHVMQLDPAPLRAPKPATTPACKLETEAESAHTNSDEGASASTEVTETTDQGPATLDNTAAPEPPLPKSPVRTEYAMSRPQRNHARPVTLHYEDPHQMVRCTPFLGQPLSGATGSQPFKLVVHTNAQLQMDFHAHLMLSEVIGLLGGIWDAGKKVLTVTRAFPCEALESEDAHTNVEMDPGSELVVRHQIMDAGLRVVGWYHSHPTFRPDPSIIDIENQTAYQALFRDNESSEEPFVGAIVGPYDSELPGPVSVFNWFYVGKSAVDRGHPKRLMVETMPDKGLPATEQHILLQLLDNARELKNHAVLEEAWRPSSTELRSLKMAVSLAHRMPWLAAAPRCDSGPGTPTVLAGHTAIEAKLPPELSAEAALADSASDCTAAGGSDHLDIEKRISPACLLAGQCAMQDQFLAALSSRFAVGVFKTGPDGRVADPLGLKRVYAAYFMQWSA
ncbi:hypothetical protein BX661DRAFT_142767 [Kickxella alabastrina]|uniref:uncharacterized protein n=1 Tax=Kickxella alabastrina TaxID=61397 RepID=UPI00221E81A5|nr:uncharacterized protein BX661DRAFT_142767 [Kickxella alabastrina]KAI7828462.1 hypothetical protein BX661DRAFT_142767 [Kickxella alabastrina]